MPLFQPTSSSLFFHFFTGFAKIVLMTQNNQRLQHLDRHDVYFWQPSVRNEHFIFCFVDREEGKGARRVSLCNIQPFLLSYSCIVYTKLILPGFYFVNLQVICDIIYSKIHCSTFLQCNPLPLKARPILAGYFLPAGPQLACPHFSPLVSTGFPNLSTGFLQLS